MKKPETKPICGDNMEIYLSTVSIFALGAFLGALVGRSVTFGIMGLVLLVILILKY
jgi:hypothetical protein